MVIAYGKSDMGRAACFALIVFLVSCDSQCSVALPHSVVGWSAVCDCGISSAYSFAFMTRKHVLEERRYFKKTIQ